MRFRKIIIILKYLTIITSLLFIVTIASRFRWENVNEIEIDIWMLAISVTLSLVFRYYIAFIWSRSLANTSEEKTPNYYTICKIYSTSWIARYIPGGIFSHASRAMLSSQHGIKLKISILASIKETTFQILSLCFLLIVLSMYLYPNSPIQEIALTSSVLILGISLLAINKKVQNLLNNALKYITKKRGPNFKVETTTVISGLLHYALAMIIANVSFVLFCASILTIGITESIGIIIANITISILSIIVFFVPAGIGIREAGLTTLLAPIIGIDAALIISISSRAWTIFTDIIFYVLCHLTSFLEKIGFRKNL